MSQRNIILIVVVVLIIASIGYLESRKSGGVTIGDENNADIVLERNSEPTEVTEEETATTTVDVEENPEEVVEAPAEPPVSIAPATTLTLTQKSALYPRGKEITTPDAFVNVESVSVEGELEKGNIVLIDFWTYSCINCQRTTPFLNDWHDKYGDKGLTIIGVHTPEFEFEKDLANVEDAVERFGIEYSVVLDNDYSTWRSYQNNYWPRKYLIDIDGFIVYDRIGEGAYAVTEAKIVELLNERNERLEEDMEKVVAGEAPTDVDTVDFGQILSKETYLGYERVQYIVDLPKQECIDFSCDYEAPEELELKEFSFDGTWRMEGERSVMTEEDGGIVIRFHASKVNLVAEGLDGSVHAEVYLDGQPIGERGGFSVENSEVVFDEAQLYNLVDLGGEYTEHLLEIRAVDGEDWAAFAFSFG